MNVNNPSGGATLELADRRDQHRVATNAAWLLRLRWVAVVGQLLTIGASHLVLVVNLRVYPLVAIVAFTAVSNLILTIWYRIRLSDERSLSPRQEYLYLGIVMTVDLLSLSALLFFAGGIGNPFAIFYFVNLALAAVILPSRWGWTLTTIAVVCLIGLLFQANPLAELTAQPLVAWQVALTLQQAGLIVAFTTSAVVVVYFITRLTSELREREVELRMVEQQRSRSEKLEALGTLAAGAGHELATPLSTIAVVAKELTHHLQGANVSDAVIEDVTLIRSEVDHCRTILDRMTGNFDEERTEGSTRISCTELLEHALSELSDRERVRVHHQDAVNQAQLRVPLENISQAIRGVMQNALDASETTQAIECRVDVQGDFVEFVIVDHGTGMSEDVLKRAGEPFFTTKEPGQGMGLGLFLTRSVIERQGGSLELHSEPGKGVTASIRLPIST
ncbi:MAG TPA: sensor histidine kinase [Planctomycetaceae bacterium]|nr:sensor histidine kinase [Planctomycetaceae bacterium]